MRKDKNRWVTGDSNPRPLERDGQTGIDNCVDLTNYYVEVRENAYIYLQKVSYIYIEFSRCFVLGELEEE